jgi:hypothetical protein
MYNNAPLPRYLNECSRNIRSFLISFVLVYLIYFRKKNLSIYTQCYSNVISFQKMKFLGKRDKSDVYKKPVIYEVNTISDKSPGGSMS